jgi:hypothetical protein
MDAARPARTSGAGRLEVNMRRILSGLALLVFGTTLGMAGEIYGAITEGGKSVGEGVPVEARCGEKTYPAVKTEKSGSYHVTVQETGKCLLAVQYKGQVLDVEVASYDEGVQVDLVLEQKDGKYVMRRK